MFYQALSLVGALLVLGAFGLLNAGRQKPADLSYVLMNFVGASLLTWVAVADRRVGFILLESTWALMSLLPLLRRRGKAGGAQA
ncbi:MAG: hypothetical protein AMXMBFR53_12240 [Gemmatimonadota bacterium]